MTIKVRAFNCQNMRRVVLPSGERQIRCTPAASTQPKGEGFLLRAIKRLAKR